MKKWMTLFVVFYTFQLFAQQEIKLDQAKFSTGDNAEWKNPAFNDSQWTMIKTNTNWEYQGFKDYNGYAWYRFHFYLSTELKNKSLWKDSIRIVLGKIDDNDETFLNGSPIGKTDGWNILREYHIGTNHPALKWDAENVISIRVFDSGGSGGMFGGKPSLSMMDIIDGINISLNFSTTQGGVVIVHNGVSKPVDGKLYASVIDPENNKVINNINRNISLKAGDDLNVTVTNNVHDKYLITATFEEAKTGKTIDITRTTPYILTPAVSDLPKINGAKIVGVRRGSPVLYKIAATGQKPITY